MTYAIGGARGVIEDPERAVKASQKWASEHHVEVLLADAAAVFGKDHLESAIRHAVRAQSAGTMVARSFSLETLRYLSAQRQVAHAIRVAGIRRGTRAVAVVVFGSDSTTEVLKLFGWTQDDAVLDARGKSFEVFGITKEEASTVPPDRRADLILEKVALLDVLK